MPALTPGIRALSRLSNPGIPPVQTPHAQLFLYYIHLHIPYFLQRPIPEPAPFIVQKIPYAFAQSHQVVSPDLLRKLKHMHEIQNLGLTLTNACVASVINSAFVGNVKGDVWRHQGGVRRVEDVEEEEHVEGRITPRKADLDVEAAVVAAEEQGFEIIPQSVLVSSGELAFL
jgi:hypothetical protein